MSRFKERLLAERDQILAELDEKMARAKELDVVVNGDDQRAETSRKEVVRVLKARQKENIARGGYDPFLHRELAKRQASTPEEMRVFYLLNVFEVMRSPYTGIKVAGANRFGFNGEDYKGFDALQEAVSEYMGIEIPGNLDPRYFRLLVEGVRNSSKSGVTEERVDQLRKETLEKIVNLDKNDFEFNADLIHGDDLGFLLLDTDETDDSIIDNVGELFTTSGWSQGNVATI